MIVYVLLGLSAACCLIILAAVYFTHKIQAEHRDQDL